MSEPIIQFGTVDLTNCDQEPIHIPGSVQPHGALLAVDPQELRIIHAGGDTVGLLGAPAGALLGVPLTDVLERSHQQRLRELLDTHRPMVRPVYAFTLTEDEHGTTDVIAHLGDGLLILEFEPRHLPIIADALALVQNMVRHLQRSASMHALFDAIAT